MTDLHLLSFGTLPPEAPYYVFYGTRFEYVVCRFDKYHMAFDFISHTQTNTRTGHTGTSRLTRNYILTPTAICSKQLSVLH